MKISIIIRTKNESKWIAYCLKSLETQEFDGKFEVIVVDSGSTDNTLEIVNLIYPSAKIILPFDSVYLPGKFINYGLAEVSKKTEYVILLSAHCVPTSNQWLKGMVESIEISNGVVGAYCKQIPCRSTNFENKRDLVNSFGDEVIIKSKDAFFHNAASIVSTETLKNFPFCASAKHIEDRLWAEEVLRAGMKIKYDPSISVIHEHGLNQHTNNYSSLRGQGVAKLQKESTDIQEFERNLGSLTKILLVAVNAHTDKTLVIIDKLKKYQVDTDTSSFETKGMSLKELIKRKLEFNIEDKKIYYDFVLYVNCSKMNPNLNLEDLCEAVIARNADMCFFIDEITNDYFVMDNQDDRLIVRSENIMNKYSAKEHVKVARYEHGTFVRSNFLLNNETLGETVMFEHDNTNH